MDKKHLVNFYIILKFFVIILCFYFLLAKAMLWTQSKNIINHASMIQIPVKTYSLRMDDFTILTIVRKSSLSSPCLPFFFIPS